MGWYLLRNRLGSRYGILADISNKRRVEEPTQGEQGYQWASGAPEPTSNASRNLFLLTSPSLSLLLSDHRLASCTSGAELLTNSAPGERWALYLRTSSKKSSQRSLIGSAWSKSHRWSAQLWPVERVMQWPLPWEPCGWVQRGKEQFNRRCKGVSPKTERRDG